MKKAPSRVPLWQFRRKILAYYRRYGRDLPWRHTRDPYHILVSEIMLQQTQASRVVLKYEEFLKLFPNFSKLAKASPAAVLRVWQGLGYNRRGLALHRLAKIITAKYQSTLPSDVAELEKLPGIGPYTAGAIMVFAFNQPVVILETNIRRVFLHDFFPDVSFVHDREIKGHIEKTLDQKNPREWYYALMDYGAMLRKTIPNPNRRSKHYAKQSPFEGSNRQKRGRMLKAWLGDSNLAPAQLERKLQKLFPQAS